MTIGRACGDHYRLVGARSRRVRQLWDGHLVPAAAGGCQQQWQCDKPRQRVCEPLMRPAEAMTEHGTPPVERRRLTCAEL